ncbi:MAG TPA: sigma-70 family RNA polymerase sigma factor [Acidobacteriaceae bacterium]|nr:sigma-70 family RNA polymerase sigma factor [Acidobacteriaceae bacterium]
MRTEETRFLLEEVWRSHSRRLLTVAWRITRNREDAEDALQDTFLRSFTHCGDFGGRSSLSTWLTRIAINSSLMVLRKRRTAAAVSLEDGEDRAGLQPVAFLRDAGPGPEELALRRDGVKSLRKHINRLPAMLRQPMQLHTLDQHSVQETARLCDISVSAAKSRLFRARTKLASSLPTGFGGARRESTRQPLAS